MVRKKSRPKIKYSQICNILDSMKMSLKLPVSKTLIWLSHRANGSASCKTSGKLKTSMTCSAIDQDLNNYNITLSSIMNNNYNNEFVKRSGQEQLRCRFLLGRAHPFPFYLATRLVAFRTFGNKVQQKQLLIDCD